MDIGRYFDRIGYRGAPMPDLDTLRTLHYLHPCAIPFENLSTLIGEPVPLELPALEEKLVVRRRGGYCFEQNTLFQHVLETIGYTLTPLAARVVWNQDDPATNPRTHMAMLVTLGGERYLCDVGFGVATLTAPLKLSTDVEQTTPHEMFRFIAIHDDGDDGDRFEQQISVGKQWRSTYRFDLQPQLPIDYAAMNHFVATHPDSPFLSALKAGRPHGTGRTALADNVLSRYERGQRIERRRVATGSELRRVLESELGIDLPRNRTLDEVLDRIALRDDALSVG